MLYLELLLLAAIVVFIVDISGIVETLKSAVGRWLGIRIERLKPFDCSLCMVWWCGLLYLWIVGRFSLLPIAVVALLATFSLQISGILQVARGLVQWVIDAVLDAIDK